MRRVSRERRTALNPELNVSFVPHRAAVAILAALCMASPAAAQQPLPKDSLEIGRKVVGWLMRGPADSVFAYLDIAFSAQVGGVAGISEQMQTLTTRAGAETSVMEERFAWRNGKRQYWRTMNVEKLGEPLLVRVVIEPSGLISGLGINPLSMAPPADSAGPPIKKP